VTLRDLRFLSSATSRRGFVVDINLDKNLHVRSESFSFSAPSRRGETHTPGEEEEPRSSAGGATPGRLANRR